MLLTIFTDIIREIRGKWEAHRNYGITCSSSVCHLLNDIIIIFGIIVFEYMCTLIQILYLLAEMRSAIDLLVRKQPSSYANLVCLCYADLYRDRFIQEGSLGEDDLIRKEGRVRGSFCVCVWG